MLHLIFGAAGTGKTTELLARARNVAESGGRVILLVPEQFSFAGEQMLHRALGPRLSLRAEALSFTRLCNGVFRRYGGLAGISVNRTAKYLLMSVAVEQLQEYLHVYRKSCRNTAFLETLVDACAEFKAAGVSPEALSRCAEDCGDSVLRDKLRDLSALYGAYQALLVRGYTDPDDDILRACAILEEERDYFSDCHVFVDGFATFMAAEFRLLGLIIAGAREAHFALTADSLHDAHEGLGVFSTVQAAAQRLVRMAREAGAEVASPVVFREPLRYRAAALAHIAGNFLRPDAPGRGESAGVTLHAAPEPYREAAYIAACIARLVREEGYRYREIAVVARDPEPYRRALETVFPRYGVPFFLDGGEDIKGKLLPACVLSALEAVRLGFDTDSVLLFAKSPLAGLEEEAVAALENYCYSWGVRGAAWQGPFAGNPRGMAGPLTEEDRALLLEINRTRERAVAPLLSLREALRRGSGRDFAAGIFALLQELGVPARITGWAQGLPQEERTAFLDEAAQLWDILIGVLDVFGSVLGGSKLPQGRLCELFRLALSAADVASLPQTLDQVLVGAADRVRPGEVRAVFVMGAEEGVFPLQPAPGGVFTDAERQELIRAGVEISAPSLQRAVLERFFCYFALTLPSERLWVSFSRSDLSGRERLPSLIVSGLQALFPGLGLDAPPEEFFAQSGTSALHLLAEHYREDTPLTATLLAEFAERPEAAPLLRGGARREHALHARAARGLFGGDLRLSPSRIERYYSCPFSYFAAEGLRVRARGRVEFSPLESGSVIHNVLQVMVQRHGGKGLASLPPARMEEEVRGVIREYLEGRVESLEALPARSRHLFGRLCGTLSRLLRHIGEEFAQSEYLPLAFELPIGPQEGVEPLSLRTADGARVEVEGVIDRVDILRKNGRKYVRVVDYKSGVKQFQLRDILYGLNMQMLLYLFTVAENGRGELEGAIPAGVLYMPVRESYVSGARGASEEDTLPERRKQWRMNGLLLEDEESLRGMESGLAGIFIPARAGKDGSLGAQSSLAGKAEMGRLARKVKELVIQMAQSLAAGAIAARPVEGEGYEPCAWCDYRSVCGFEPGDRVRAIARLDREEVFALLEEEENGR